MENEADNVLYVPQHIHFGENIYQIECHFYITDYKTDLGSFVNKSSFVYSCNFDDSNLGNNEKDSSINSFQKMLF